MTHKVINNFFLFIISIMQVNSINAQNAREIIIKIENTNWLDTAADNTRMLVIKKLLIENREFDKLEWENTDTVKSLIIGSEAKYRQGSYETNYSKSNLQKKIWIIECIIAKKIITEKYILDNKRKKILLDFPKTDEEDAAVKKDKDKIKKIYLIYKKYFFNTKKEKKEIKTPLLNFKYTWVNPYMN